MAPCLFFPRTCKEMNSLSRLRLLLAVLAAKVSLRGTIIFTRMHFPKRTDCSIAHGRASQAATTALRSSSATMSKTLRPEYQAFPIVRQLTTTPGAQQICRFAPEALPLQGRLLREHPVFLHGMPSPP